MQFAKLILALLVLTATARADDRSKAQLFITPDVRAALLDGRNFKNEQRLPFSIKYRGRVTVGHIRARADSITGESVRSPAGLSLFKGSSRLGGPRSQARLTVAAALYKGVFTVNFTDNGHPYSAEFNLATISPNGIFGSLRKVPSYIKIDEGHAVSSSIPSARSSLNDGGSTLSSSYLLELRAVADGSLVSLLGSPEAAFVHILSAVNTAETIYSSQLNAVFRVVDMQKVANSVLSATDADGLLDEFKANEDGNFSSAQDLSHLFTGKELAGSTVGLAYLAVLCDFPDFSVGLTQVKSFQSLTALIFAHEVGHNLGADHDDVTPSLMSSYVSSSQDAFSDFSLSEINSYLGSYGSCLTKSSSNPDPELSNYFISNVTVFSKGRFLLMADLLNAASASCSISVYGATVKSRLEADRIASEGTVLSSFNATLGSIGIRVRGMPTSVSGARRIFFRTRSECDGISGLSDIYTITLGAGGSISRDSWLSLLDSKPAVILPN
jgi:hypothetical protein